MNTPKVSIIIPTYNCEEYIMEAVDSALSQTYQNSEIVVVDDGSTDGTKLRIAPFLRTVAPGRLRYFYQEHRGASAARNLGFEKAGGDYLLFLDSDDIILPTMIETLVNYLKENTPYGVAYSDFRYFEDSNKDRMFKPAFIARYYSGAIFGKLVEEGNFVAMDSALVRRKCISEAGLARGSRLIDWSLWLRIAYQGYQFYHVDDVLLLVRRRRQSLSSDKLEMFRSRVDVLEEVNKYVIDQRLKRHLNLRQKIANAHFWLGWMLLKSGSKHEGINELVKWLKMYLTSDLTAIMRNSPRNLRLLLQNVKD